MRMNEETLWSWINEPPPDVTDYFPEFMIGCAQFSGYVQPDGTVQMACFAVRMGMVPARVYKTSKNGELKNGERFSNRPMVHFLKESNVNDSAKANSVFCCSVYGTY